MLVLVESVSRSDRKWKAQPLNLPYLGIEEKVQCTQPVAFVAVPSAYEWLGPSFQGLNVGLHHCPQSKSSVFSRGTGHAARLQLSVTDNDYHKLLPTLGPDRSSAACSL